MEIKIWLQLIARWAVKNGIWILLAASLYMVLAAEFRELCFIKLPINEETIDKLNGIGKRDQGTVL